MIAPSVGGRGRGMLLCSSVADLGDSSCSPFDELASPGAGGLALSRRAADSFMYAQRAIRRSTRPGAEPSGYAPQPYGRMG